MRNAEGSGVVSFFSGALLLLAIGGFPLITQATTHGSTDSDVSFVLNGDYAAFQNLGNGNFTSGAAVVGLDLRASTTPNNLLFVSIQGYDLYSGAQTTAFSSGEVSTIEGDHIYHFAIPSFVPDPSTCYFLQFYQSSQAPMTFFGSSESTYTASSGGCFWPFNTDDIPVGMQNPALYGHGLKDYSFVIYDDGNVAPPPPPIPLEGKTYGDIDYDFSFPAHSSYAAFQNLGNGSFAEGNTVLGVDVRVGTVPGNFIAASIREADSNGNQTGESFGGLKRTIEGNTVYHFDLPAFTPDPHKCYQLLFYQQYDNGLASTYYGHSNDVYVASSTGCVYGRDSDDRSSLNQNPSLNVPGYIDYSFRIHTDGPISTPSCTQDCFSNVLFLPGIESSRLYGPQVVGSPEHKLWEPSGDGDVKDLFLTQSGQSWRNDIYAKEGDVLDELPVTGENIYKSFIAKMDGLKAQHLINDWEAAAYDWRLSLDDILQYGDGVGGKLYYSGELRATSTPYIIQELRRLAATSKTGKVTIVAHSNGGLVAKRLTEILGSDASSLIDTMIFVAVPQAGTPMAVAAGMHGFNQANGPFGLVTSAATARTFASTSPMFYHLLPSAQYFTYVDDPIITFDASLPNWISRYGQIIHSRASLDTFLADTYGKVDSQTGDINQPIQLSNTLLANSETLHDDLDNWTPPAGIKLIQIAGWGVPTTVTGIRYKKKGTGVGPEPNFTIDGDGTVVIPSALWTSTTTGAINYWTDLHLYDKQHPIVTLGGLLGINHADILEIPELLNFISDEITNQSKSISSYNYLFAQSPSNPQNRLRYALHSPLTLDAYDDLGHHTGVSTTTNQVEEGIPGSYFVQFGDIKYLFTDTDAPVHIVMQGYATSTFTFEADQLQGDTLEASTTWKDMPTTPQTIVNIGTPSGLSTLTPLMIDINGDGTTDLDLSPKLNGTVTVPYRWDGFLPPINDTAHQIGQSLSVFKAGSTVPVKFQLKKFDGTVIQATSSAPLWLTPQRGSAVTGPPDSVYTAPGTTGNLFMWDSISQQYIYNWNTKGLKTGYWYRIYAQLDDGKIYSVVVGLR